MPSAADTVPATLGERCSAVVLATTTMSMLRASVHGSVRVMIPMVTTLGELRAARQQVALAKEELRERGIDVPDVPLGIMVETPSAVFSAELLAAESGQLPGPAGQLV